MKTLTVPIPDWNHTLPRVVVFCLAVAGLGIATWYGMRPRPVDNGGSFVEEPQAPPPNGYDDQTQPVVYRDRATTDGRCSQWDVSPVAMEAILQEMLRRGWKPPTQGEAISSIAGAKIVSLDPNAPMPVFTRPTAPPVETVEPEEGAVSGDPDPSATPPVTTTPATRPPATGPSRPPATQPSTATPPRPAPPAATSPKSPSPPAAPKPATPPATTQPAAPPAEPAQPADPT